MKIALVTTPPSVPSGIGDYTRHLLPHLSELADVEVFVAPGHAGEAIEGLRTRAADELAPRAFDHILYQLGNERHHAFMVPMVRKLGGTVVQHDWVLFDLAVSAFAELARGGVRGHWAALREGGVGQARRYVEHWLERKRQRERASVPVDADGLEGELLDGWHAAEAGGRWTADVALLRLPTRSCRSVRLCVDAPPGRAVSLSGPQGAGERVEFTRERAEARLELPFARASEPLVRIVTEGIRVDAAQRKRGDARRLGCFVTKLEYADDDGVHGLDLGGASAHPLRGIELSSRRFELSLNRSIVRLGDAFLVHSESMKRRILEERNALTPIGVVSHGAEPRWHDEPRPRTRARLGLDASWGESFLIGSFGALQTHKRVDKVLEAFARARTVRPELKLVLIGRLDGDAFDVRAAIRALRLDDAVLTTDHVAEATAFDYIHACDLMVQLRGPSTGGTSGGAFQSLSLGRAVIASAYDEQNELPGDCVLRVAHGAAEVEDLTRLFVELAGDRARVDALEQAARRFVKERASWRRCAERYLEHLQLFPAPRSARRSLLGMRFDAARRRLRERG